MTMCYRHGLILLKEVPASPVLSLWAVTKGGECGPPEFYARIPGQDSLLGFPHGVSMTVFKPKCGDAHLTPWPVLELSLIYCCLFMMCACMCRHAHAMACMRRSEDSLLRLVLFPPCGSWRSNAGIWLGSEHPSLSHLAGPLLCLLFSLLFMETTPEHKALMHRRVFQRLHSERLT